MLRLWIEVSFLYFFYNDFIDTCFIRSDLIGIVLVMNIIVKIDSPKDCYLQQIYANH